MLPFQANEQSYIVGSVCKLWNEIIVRCDVNPRNILEFYAKYGYLSCLKWCKNVYNGYGWWYVCTIAAEFGHLDIVKWARENEFLWDSYTCAVAARNGHFDVLRWAHENGCPWSETTCECAAASGHLQILQWAIDHGCPFENSALMLAAYNGHLGILQWARESGLWNDRLTKAASSSGKAEVAKWLMKM